MTTKKSYLLATYVVILASIIIDINNLWQGAVHLLRSHILSAELSLRYLLFSLTLEVLKALIFKTTSFLVTS